MSARAATSRAPRTTPVALGTQRPAVGPRHDVRIEHRDERLEVAIARGGEEGVDDPSLSGEVGVGHRGCPLDAAPRAAGELPRRLRRAIDEAGDLVERHGEHVVQHERQPLGRCERLEHHEQRQPHRVGQQRLVLGLGPVVAADDRVGHADVQRLLAPRPARAQHVEAHPRDDRRQPRAQVLDFARVRSAEPQPALLDRVVGLAQRAEHLVGHRSQVGAVLLELLRQEVVLVHRSHPSRRQVSRRVTHEIEPM